MPSVLRNPKSRIEEHPPYRSGFRLLSANPKSKKNGGNNGSRRQEDTEIASYRVCEAKNDPVLEYSATPPSKEGGVNQTKRLAYL